MELLFLHRVGLSYVSTFPAIIFWIDEQNLERFALFCSYKRRTKCTWKKYVNHVKVTNVKFLQTALFLSVRAKDFVFIVFKMYSLKTASSKHFFFVTFNPSVMRIKDGIVELKKIICTSWWMKSCVTSLYRYRSLDSLLSTQTGI